MAHRKVKIACGLNKTANAMVVSLLTNRLILGRPARCPQCQRKFVLRDPSIDDENPDDSDEVVAAEGDLLDQETLGSEEFLTDKGRAYVTLEQLRQWHTRKECAGFARWVMRKTTVIAADGTGYFLEDYDEWLSAGMPDVN